MIRMEATIRLSAGGIESVVAPIGNNISSLIPTDKNRVTQKPFIIGASKLGDGSELRSKVRSYLSRITADENGTISPEFQMTIYLDGGTSQFSIVFDNEGKQFPPKIYVTFYDENDAVMIKDVFSYEDNDSTYIVPFIPSGCVKCVVRFDQWNAPNYPVKIDGVFSDILFNIGGTNLLSCETNCVDRSDLSMPSYGVISNSGSISFKDIDGEILDLAENNMLQNNFEVDVFLRDTLSKKSESVGKYYTSEWDYDNNNRSVTVKLKDDLEEWQYINVDELSFNATNGEAGTFADIYSYLYSKTPSKYNLQSYEELDDETKYILGGNILYPNLNSGNLWNAFQRLCEACWLRVYKYNGKTLCKHTKIIGG